MHFLEYGMKFWKFFFCEGRISLRFRVLFYTKLMLSKCIWSLFVRKAIQFIGTRHIAFVQMVRLNTSKNSGFNSQIYNAKFFRTNFCNTAGFSAKTTAISNKFKGTMKYFNTLLSHQRPQKLRRWSLYSRN